MSAFSALGGFDGDGGEIAALHKENLRKETEQRKREELASRVVFDDLKAKAGMSNWADDSDDEEVRAPRDLCALRAVLHWCTCRAHAARVLPCAHARARARATLAGRERAGPSCCRIPHQPCPRQPSRDTHTPRPPLARSPP